MKLIIIALLGFVLSLVILVLLMPPYIRQLKNHNLNQQVSEYALEEYKQKAKTPIMGGLLFVLIPTIVFFVITPNVFYDRNCLFVILSFLSFCLVGFIDDAIILLRRNNLGLSPVVKLVMEFIFACALYLGFRDLISREITIPFIHLSFDLGILYPLLMILMYLSEANAVNFTDGMDGLCAGVSFISLVPFIIFALTATNYNLIILIACVMGGLLGYLFFNFHPAKIFMGDSGSIALGGLFSALAVVLHKEIALIFVGGVFVLEMLCVVIQQLAVRIFHRRVFSYTPIHYAFVLKGHPEVKVVFGFYLLTCIFAVIGFVIGIF